MSDAPLAGLKVLELARVLAGPWVGQNLADLGATVIKVESPTGDDTRTWGPPFIDRGDDHSAAYFHCCNRGKQSIAVDLKTPEGQELVTRLAMEADVFVENFKVDGLKKYGLDFATLSAKNPRLVYCSITGFGQTGPYAHRAGYDYLVQGMSGLMSLTGDIDGEPQKVGIALSDIFTGLYGVIGIQAALTQRQKTGLGQHIDMGLLDCATAVMSNQAMNYLATGKAPKRLGNAHPNIVPYQVFRTTDGAIIVAAGNDRQYRAFARVLQRPDLAEDARFSSNGDRVTHRDVLVPILNAEAAKFTKAKLLEALEDAGVPAGPINTMDEVFNDPQVIARGLKITPDGVPGVDNPLKMSASSTTSGLPSPKLDEHGDAIRRDGFNAKF